MNESKTLADNQNAPMAVASGAVLGVSELCQQIGIELRGADGQPYCCGQRMTVKSGIIGTDFAECQICKKAIGNMASPHINGGGIPTDEWLNKQGDRTWVRLDA